MKTVEEIIAYLEIELACAKKMHDVARGNGRLYFLLKVRFITELLEEIKR